MNAKEVMWMGWVRLHRKLLDSAVFNNPVLLKVWVWCLFKATYKAHDQVVGLQVVHLEPGQFVYGRVKCSKELDISDAMLYRHMKTLEKLGNVNINPHSKFSVITIVNWSLYQGGNGDDEQENEQQMNSKRTADEQQMNTNNKGKKGNKDKKIISPNGDTGDAPTAPSPDTLTAQSVVNLYNYICLSLPKVSVLTEKRKKKLLPRIREHPDIEWWRALFRRVQATPGLCGDNDRGWRATLDWLIKDDTVAVNILEGRYDNWRSKGGDTIDRAPNGRPIDSRPDDGYPF